MGATLLKEFKVFRMADSNIGGDLFGSSDTVIVASFHCEKNCYPHNYKWSFEFIGNVNSFQNVYLPRTAYYFDDGLSQSPVVANGAAFIAHLKRLFEGAGVLTVSDMHDLSWTGYSWGEDTISKLDSVDHLIKFTYWLGTRYAAQIETQADIDRMVAEAFKVVPPGSDQPWLACLWRLDAAQIKTIMSAPSGSDFRMAI